MLAEACAVIGPLVVFGIYLAVIGFVYWSMLFLRALPKALARALIVGVCVFGLSAPLQAYSPDVNDPARCGWLISLGTPCWLLQALWCPCELPPPPPDGF